MGVVTPETKIKRMSTTTPPDKEKVIVLLDKEEHATLKQIVKRTRRTLGQEMAFRAFQALDTADEKESRNTAKPASKKERAAS